MIPLSELWVVFVAHEDVSLEEVQEEDEFEIVLSVVLEVLGIIPRLAGNLEFSKLLNCSRGIEDELKEVELGKEIGEEQEAREAPPPSSSSMATSMVGHVPAA